jgi:hypothetical protein
MTDTHAGGGPTRESDDDKLLVRCHPGCSVALDYAHRGWPVLPLWWPTDGRCACPRGAGCTSAAKHPLSEHGLDDATTDVDVIVGWGRRWPHANVGIRTGVAFDVLDVDSLDALDVLDGLGNTVCGGPIVRTGRGWQFYFAATGHGNRAGLVDHVDWGGAGGYVVAPPSVHVTGKRYRWWHEGDEAFEPPPPAIRALLEPARREPVPHRPPGNGRTRKWSGLVATVALAPEGQRNDRLNWAAHTLGTDVTRGRIQPGDVARALDDLRIAAVRAGLSEAEAEATIRSGFEAAR